MTRLVVQLLIALWTFVASHVPDGEDQGFGRAITVWDIDKAL